MPTNRNHRKRKRRAGSVASPVLVSMLADPGDIETTVGLAARIGNPPLDGLDDDKKEDVEKGVAILRKLWPIYAERAVEYCIKRDGPGVRPTLWWEGKARPYVKPRDIYANDVNDAARYANERKAADLEYLRSHGLLTKEEIQKLEKEKGD